MNVETNMSATESCTIQPAAACALSAEVNMQREYRILIVDDNRKIHEDFRKILARGSEEDVEFDRIERAFFAGDNESGDSVDCSISGTEQAVDPARSCPDMTLESAYQGRDALELVRQAAASGNSFDMAFVDMRMPPGWDGVETTQQLWAVDPGLQIVICTAYSDYSWSEILDRMGHTDQLLLLKKPFDNAEVFQLASALTKKRHLQRIANAHLRDVQTMIERRTAELEAAHIQSEQLLNSISSVVIELDSLGVVTRWNPTAESVFNLLNSEVIGRRIDELEISWNQFEPSLLFADSVGNSPVPAEIEFFDGEQTRVVGLTIYPVESFGNPKRFLVLGKELTEKKQIEQQLRTAQKLEAVGQLAAGVAHEINTPMQYLGDNVKYVRKSFETILNVVRTYQEIVNNPENNFPPNEDGSLHGVNVQPKQLESLIQNIPEALEDSEKGVANISRIVRAIKQFSHPGQQARTLVDINESLDNTLTVARNEWKYIARAVTDFDFALPQLMGYPGELNQVFLNLIVNATHAILEKLGEESEERGLISVSTRAHNDFAEIRITDTGAGIPEQIQNRIFDPLFTTKDVGKGTGQGLAITHQVIVQKHNGSIFFESEPGVGTTFVVRLPYDSESHPELFSPETEPDTGRQWKWTGRSGSQAGSDNEDHVR